MGKKIVATPILKWAGSKLRLIKQLEEYLPSFETRFEYYIEPFVGGGALLFWMLNNRSDYFGQAVAYDHNRDLINMYKTVQKDVESLIEQLESLQAEIRAATDPREYYLERRSEYNCSKTTDVVRRSALLIFLNRTCYNGLYRVNRLGEFNVPYGKRPNALICNAEVLRKDSEDLRCVEFVCGDYSEALAPDGFQDRSFFYFDPPYRPLSPTSSFDRYTKDVFGERQQIELAEHCQMLNRQGAHLMISNADTSGTRPNDMFYEEHFPRPPFYHHRVFAPRLVNANPHKRGPIPEILITNYRPVKLKSVKRKCR